MKKANKYITELKICSGREHIVNDDFTINCVEFTINGVTYINVGVRDNGKLENTIDCWRIHGTDRYLETTRKQLYWKTRRSIIIFEPPKNVWKEHYYPKSFF